MNIKVFWDPQSPQGLQLPVSRLISMILDRPVEVLESPLLVDGFDRGRNQHDAQKILDRIWNTYILRFNIHEPILLVVPCDLYVNGCDFVFGLARPRIGAAVVSAARLDNTYYGRDAHDEDLMDRIAKEGAHELGHILGLDHCTNPECAMFRPATLDELDRKKKMLCPVCRQALSGR